MLVREYLKKETGKMTFKNIETEDAALTAAKEKLDGMLISLSKEERSTLLCLLLRAMK